MWPDVCVCVCVSSNLFLSVGHNEWAVLSDGMVGVFGIDVGVCKLI